MAEPKTKNGVVTRSSGSWYEVLAQDDKIISCRIKGKFRAEGIRTTNPVAVGDRISFEEFADGTGIIRHINERTNFIIRKSVKLSRHAHIIAANVDRAYLVVTLVNPPTSTEFIDRFLVTAEANNIPVTIIFNKIDIYGEDEMGQMEFLESVYAAAGYPILKISAHNEADIKRVSQQLNDKVNLLCGHSGVGKSTLINTINRNTALKTSAVSESYDAGKHTTTFAEMLPLPNGGFIIDTPGIKGFGIIDMDKDLIAHYYPEMNSLRSQCKFNNCIHINEPECAVKQAVENRGIASSRYDSYLSIYNADETEIYR